VDPPFDSEFMHLREREGQVNHLVMVKGGGAVNSCIQERGGCASGDLGCQGSEFMHLHQGYHL
jgi:hypothetical protein